MHQSHNRLIWVSRGWITSLLLLFSGALAGYDRCPNCRCEMSISGCLRICPFCGLSLSAVSVASGYQPVAIETSGCDPLSTAHQPPPEDVQEVATLNQAMQQMSVDQGAPPPVNPQPPRQPPPLLPVSGVEAFSSAMSQFYFQNQPTLLNTGHESACRPVLDCIAGTITSIGGRRSELQPEEAHIKIVRNALKTTGSLGKCSPYTGFISSEPGEEQQDKLNQHYFNAFQKKRQNVLLVVADSSGNFLLAGAILPSANLYPYQQRMYLHLLLGDQLFIIPQGDLINVLRQTLQAIVNLLSPGNSGRLYYKPLNS